MLCDGGSVQIGGSGLLGCVLSKPFGYRYLYLHYVHAKNQTYLLLIPGPKPQSTATLPSMAVLIIEVCFVIWGKTELFANFLVKKYTLLKKMVYGLVLFIAPSKHAHTKQT